MSDNTNFTLSNEEFIKIFAEGVSGMSNSAAIGFGIKALKNLGVPRNNIKIFITEIKKVMDMEMSNKEAEEYYDFGKW